MDNLFKKETDEELKCIYKEILESREEGVRPKILDPYIRKIRDVYPLTVSESWEIVEKLFWEEVARRHFFIKE